MRLSVLRGVGIASVGAIVLCVPTATGVVERNDMTKIANTVTSKPAQSGARQAVLGSWDKVASTRFEFGVPVDPDTQIGRIAPETRAGPSARDVEPTSAAPATLPASAAPAALASVDVAAHDAPKLSFAGIRALQRELKRLGCYWGRIDGDWGPASRYAAAMFIASVNAALPVDSPEPVLLALARQHNGSNCNKITEGDVLVTASTTPITRAPIITPVAATDNIKADGDQSTQKVTPTSARAWDPPRIVRANGMRITGGELATVARGEIVGRRHMALGAEPTSAQEVGSTASQKAKRVPRSRSKSSTARRAGRGHRKRWKRQVFRSINLDGG